MNIIYLLIIWESNLTISDYTMEKLNKKAKNEFKSRS